MRSLGALLLFVSSIASPAIAAEETPARDTQQTRLDAAGLRAAFSGKTHISRYRLSIEEYGGVNFEETYRGDGSLSYRAGDVAATGTWRIEGDAICFLYDAIVLVPACFAVTERNGCFYSYEIVGDGSPRGLAEGAWWIRSHIDGTDPDCARDAIS